MAKRLLPLFASLLIVSACGDSTVPPGDDTPDAMQPCGGHGQPECTGDQAEYLKHNGGEIRLEYVTAQNGTLQIILYAFFLSSQMPDGIPYPIDGTSNVLASVNSTNPGMEVNDSRVYMDVGDTVTLSHKEQTITLNRYTNIADKRGLIMDIGYAVDGASKGTVDPNMILPGAEYTIAIGGVVQPYKLKLPTPWQTMAGNVVFALNATTNLTKGTDISWQYDFVDEPYNMGALLVFAGNNSAGVKESWLTIGGATGKIDIPGTTMATFPASGTLQGAVIVHQKLNVNGRVLDVIGVNCKQTPYVIQ
jgi:hypothetical protein